MNVTTASTILTAHDRKGDYPIVTRKESKGVNISCIGLTWFPWYLKMGYPESIRQLFLDMIGDAVGYKINAQGEGLGDVTFHAYENGIVAFATKGMESQEKSTIKDVMNEVQLQTRIEEGWLKTSIQMEPAELLVLKIKIAS